MAKIKSEASLYPCHSHIKYYILQYGLYTIEAMACIIHILSSSYLFSLI
jgi:hypothetical protein